MSKFKDDIAEIMADTTIKNKNQAIANRIKEYNQNKRIYEDRRAMLFVGTMLGIAIGSLITLVVFSI